MNSLETVTFMRALTFAAPPPVDTKVNRPRPGGRAAG